MKNGKVTFAYKGYKTGVANKPMTLEAHEFIRRLLPHVLPNGFLENAHGLIMETLALEKGDARVKPGLFL